MRANLIIRSLKPIKFLLLILFTAGMAVHGFAQKMDWKSHIDFLVEQTDSLSMKSQKTFYLPKIIRVDKTFRNDLTIKETWNYTVNEGKVIIFQVRYVIDHREFTEVYYLNNDRLICMESYEAPYLSSYVDEVRRGEIFFLVNNNLKQYIKFGNNKKAAAPLWDAQTACLSKFEERYSQLRRNISLSKN